MAQKSIPSVSIVIPTFREAENLPALIPAIAQAMRQRGWTWEVIVVDDNSRDGTVEALQALQQTFPQLQWHIRVGQRGLSSAVLEGLGRARYDHLVVMDADLSHPPAAIGDLVDKLLHDEADFVIGSRYVAGGGTENWTCWRWLNSFGATLLSKPLVGTVRDPMSGFFALRRETLQHAAPLNPIGYKIGLELMVKCAAERVAEVPITFRNRVHGDSKLTLGEQFRYLEHLSRLYDYAFPKGSPRAKFLVAAGCGAAACAGVLGGFDAWGQSFPVAIAAGLLTMILVTLGFFARYVHTQRDFILMRHPWWEFTYISMAEFLTGWVTAIATNSTSIWVRAAFGIVILLLVRYTLRKIFLHDLRGIRGEPNAAATLRVRLGTAGTPPIRAAGA